MRFIFLSALNVGRNHVEGFFVRAVRVGDGVLKIRSPPPPFWGGTFYWSALYSMMGTPACWRIFSPRRRNINRFDGEAVESGLFAWRFQICKIAWNSLRFAKLRVLGDRPCRLAFPPIHPLTWDASAQVSFDFSIPWFRLNTYLIFDHVWIMETLPNSGWVLTT